MVVEHVAADGDDVERLSSLVGELFSMFEGLIVDTHGVRMDPDHLSGF